VAGARRATQVRAALHAHSPEAGEPDPSAPSGAPSVAWPRRWPQAQGPGGLAPAHLRAGPHGARRHAPGAGPLLAEREEQCRALRREGVPGRPPHKPPSPPGRRRRRPQQGGGAAPPAGRGRADAALACGGGERRERHWRRAPASAGDLLRDTAQGLAGSKWRTARKEAQLCAPERDCPTRRAWTSTRRAGAAAAGPAPRVLGVRRRARCARACRRSCRRRGAPLRARLAVHHAPACTPTCGALCALAAVLADAARASATPRRFRPGPPRRGTAAAVAVVQVQVAARCVVGGGVRWW